MKALVIGLGSMGRRRTRLLHGIDKTIQIVGIDMQEGRRKQAEDEFGIITASSVNEACERYSPDVAFVATSPLSHASIIQECLEHNLHVFTELNLVHTRYDENRKLAEEKERILFLSSTFLYRKEIQYIKEMVRKNIGYSLIYMYHAGQYLPDWHPWESYKSYFVGDKRTNGCREFMAVEFPWLIDVFGSIISFHVIKGKHSCLAVEFPDTYLLAFEHESGHSGLISIDVVSRKAVRKFELFGENLYLTWNGTPDSLCIYDFVKKEDCMISLYKTVNRRAEYNAFIIEDAYASEIVNFINVVEGKEKPRYSFEQDKKILNLIDEIERG